MTPVEKEDRTEELGGNRTGGFAALAQHIGDERIREDFVCGEARA